MVVSVVTTVAIVGVVAVKDDVKIEVENELVVDVSKWLPGIKKPREYNIRLI